MLLLVLPLRAYHSDSVVFIDAQAHNGLRLWLENFSRLTLACPTSYEAPPSGYLPVEDDRIKHVALPVAYTPRTFAAALLKMSPGLQTLIASSDHLHFAIGGLFGDWASVCALMAHRSGRKFAVWTDRVESKVAAFQSKTKRGPKRLYYAATAAIMKRYERAVIKRAALGLFHGMDCYEAYSAYSSNPHLVHNVHLGEESQISDAGIAERLRHTGPVRIVYAGRVHRDKGVFDWIDALSSAVNDGVDFRAVWFGDGPELESARQCVAANKLSEMVEFPGAIGDHLALIERLRTFDLFMFCHKTQESPRCLIEALMCGLPLVGYDSPYPRDLIKERGGGILSLVDRPELLPQSIRKFSEERIDLTRRAQLDGKPFNAESVFRHRSDLMKAMR